MECINCGDSKANSYYSPKILNKYNIYFCNKCIELIKNEDLRYIENTSNEYAHNEVKKLIKKR